jgi:gliding motility-associated-like protein
MKIKTSIIRLCFSKKHFAIAAYKKSGKFFLFICFIIFLFFGQRISATTPNGSWTGSIESPKVFIENKGQFHIKNSNETVLYAFDNGLEKIYFTAKGITYYFSEIEQKNDEEKEEEREKEKGKKIKTVEDWKKQEAEEHKVSYKTDEINFYWSGANDAVQVTAVEATSDYHSYCIKDKEGVVKNINFINAFKKIIYKNVYDNIDIEYTIHPTQGIKYTILLHPGADPTKIKMHYNNKCALKLNGDLEIKTLFGPLVDHAPNAFYADNKSERIAVKFSKKNNQITFDIKPYDQSKTVLIDPWVQTPTLSNSNCVWECEVDGAGNVYIIGGDSPMKLRKYNSSGTIQWTYNTPWDTSTTGSGSGNGDWLGTLATDLAGNSYITNGSSAALQKINASGSMTYGVTGGSSDEYWNITFNCDQTKLIVGGTSGTFGLPPNLYGTVFDINTSNGSVTSTKIVAYGSTTSFPPHLQEVRSITSSRNAKYYFLTLDSLGCMNQNFSACSTSPPLFKIDNTYSLSYKCENYRPSNGNAGIKGIKANRYFMYTQNGTTIHKRSLVNGSILGSAAITGGISVSSGGQNQVGNSGIDIDSCGNVYAGSGNAVIKYDASLNQLSSNSVPFRVYDVAIGYNGDVIVCGGTGNNSNTSRTGYVQSINMSSCPPMTLFCCDATVCPVGPYCTTDAPVTLTAVTPGGTWSGAGITNASTGAFSPSVAGQGTHTIIYTLPCGADSIYVTVNCCASQITPAGPFCIADAPVNLTAATTGGTWSGTGITSASAGTFSPSVAGAGTFSIIYTASCGADTISVSVGSCVSLTACKETNGDITATSGNAPYTWSNQTTTQDCSTCFSGICGFPPGCEVNTTSWTSFGTGTTVTPSGTYPIKLLDNNGDSLLITSLSSLTACPSNNCPAITTTASNITAVSCAGQSDGSFDATTTGGTSPWSYTLKDSTGATVGTFPNIAATQHVANLVAGTYTMYITDNNGCLDTAHVTISSPSGTATTAAAGPDQTLCSNSVILAGNTPTNGTGLWTLVSGTATITTPSSPTSGVTGLGVGTAIFKWTISNGSCSSSSDSVSITNTGGGPVVTISSHTDITCHGVTDGSATAVATGGTGTLTYAWTPSGGSGATATNLQAGTYTVSVNDGGGCVGFETVTIIEPPDITLTVSTTSIGCGSIGSATATANGGTAGLHYLWSNGATTASITNLTTAGTYSVTVTDDMSCNKASVAVVSASTLAITISPNVTINIGDTTQLSVAGGTTLSWSPSNGLSCTNCRDPLASPFETTTYCVVATDSICSDTACVTVTLSDSGGCGSVFIPSGSVYTPNAFTPNHDNLNDVYKPISNCVHEYSFLIFNRWGEKIFETHTTEEGWNGYYKGRLCEPDVYIFMVNFIDDPKNNYHQYTGKVLLLK